MKQEQKSKLYLALAVAAVICVALLAIIGIRKPKEQENRHGTMSSREGDITDDEVEQLPEEEPEIKLLKDSPLGKAKTENIDAAAWLKSRARKLITRLCKVQTMSITCFAMKQDKKALRAAILQITMPIFPLLTV